MHVCCFSGHRIILKKHRHLIKEKLNTELETLISQNVTVFKSGGAMGFDTVAALEVLRLKSKYPHIKLIMVLPCKEQTSGWRKKDAENYNYILENADEVIYISEHYYTGCMQKRNRELVCGSDVCVCYLTRNSGGTHQTVACAVKNCLEIINLADFIDMALII